MEREIKKTEFSCTLKDTDIAYNKFSTIDDSGIQQEWNLPEDPICYKIGSNYYKNKRSIKNKLRLNQAGSLGLEAGDTIKVIFDPEWPRHKFNGDETEWWVLELIISKNISDIEEEEEKEEKEEISKGIYFKTYEKDLEKSLVENIEEAFGQGFRVIGRQYRTKVGFLDILVKKDKTMYVVEIKIGKRTPDKTVGQILRYLAIIKELSDRGEFGEVENVRGIIMAQESDKNIKLEYSCKPVSDKIDLKYYKHENKFSWV